MSRTMSLFVSLVLGLVAVLALASGAAAQQPVSIQLSAQNNSGISGTATLTPMGAQTKVVLSLQGTPAGVTEPAHIHLGTCANLDPKPAYPLTPVQNGASETVVNVSLDQLRSTAYAINVHKSAQEAAIYVACGDLPTGGAVAGMPRTGEGGGADQPIAMLLGLGGLILLAIGGLALRRRAA